MSPRPANAPAFLRVRSLTLPALAALSWASAR